MTDFDDETTRAGTAFEALADGPATRAARAIEAAFERTGESIERSFGRAARSGELNFSNMTEAILRDLARLAAQQFIEKPLNQLMENVISSLPFAGARAEGGPVTAGGAYLVGERGPEWFVPSGAGAIEPGSNARSPRIVVNLNLGSGADAKSIQQSQTRISTALARAVAKGSRHL